MDKSKLLKLLEKDARVSTSDLALMLDASEQCVKETIAELENEGVIGGYHTIIDYDKTDSTLVTAVIEVGATPKRDTGYDAIAEEIYSYPEVSTMYLMSGKSEFIVIIKGKTMREVADFVAQCLAPIEGVTRTETYFVLRQYKVEGSVLKKKEDVESDIQPVTP